MTTKYGNFSSQTYPYGSEYSYDNTGEEAVYMLAKLNGNTTMLGKINSITATSGQPAVVSLSVGTNANYDVRIGAVCGGGGATGTGGASSTGGNPNAVTT